MNRMTYWGPRGMGAFVLVLALSGGCSDSSGDSAVDSGSTPDDGGNRSLDDARFGDSSLSDSALCLSCSSDLRSVVDCDKHVVKTCEPEEGCLDAKCISACDAAAGTKNSTGCEYYAINPYTYENGGGGCFAAYIVNTWDSPTSISVDRDGVTYDTSTFAYIPSGSGQNITYAPLPDGMLPPGQVAVLFLAATTDSLNPCPNGTGTAMTSDPAIPGTGFGKAFHIQSSLPVNAYDIYPYGGGNSAFTSATLLLPTSVWDTNYVGLDAYAIHAVKMESWMAIVASDDDTEVTLSPTAAIFGANGVDGTAKGTPHTYTLTRGQILQVTPSGFDEFDGTPIQSTKPIGVWGGASCMNVPLYTSWCDTAHQEVPPINALGYEYAAVRPRDRYEGVTESPPWRLVGTVDGTTLTYDPAPPTGAPTTLSSGQMVEFPASDAFVVRSQDDKHPFYVAGYMTGCQVYSEGFDDCRGDPEFVNVVPPKQFLTSYTFFTDPTYSETNLVIVRAKVDGAFADVTLDCRGVLDGWQPVGDFEWTRVDLVRHNFEPQNGCDNGRHQITSPKPFGVTVWGWGSGETGGMNGDPGFATQSVSYAYPAGVGLKPLTSIVFPPVPK